MIIDTNLQNTKEARTQQNAGHNTQKYEKETETQVQIQIGENKILSTKEQKKPYIKQFN